MLIVEPSRLALTTTPSIAPSSAELTCPVSATVPWAYAPAVKRAKQAAARVRQITSFICLSLVAALNLSARERGPDPLRRKRHAPQPHAGRVDESVRHRRRDDADRRLARPRGRDLRMVDQHDLDSLGRVADLQDRIAHPVDTGHLLAIEAHLFAERTRQPLHHVAFDRIAPPSR